MNRSTQESNPPRPPPSPCCGARSWWNGTRHVMIVVSLPDAGSDATPTERIRTRCKCTGCGCGFTLYEPGEYPQRVYQLDAVARVAAAHAVGAQSAATAAKQVGASATSARRWTRWIAGLVEPGTLLALTTRLDPSGPHGEGLSRGQGNCPVRTAAIAVIDALEALGVALVRIGLRLASASGLGRLLEWQLCTHGLWVPLTLSGAEASPRLVFGVDGVAAIASGRGARTERVG